MTLAATVRLDPPVLETSLESAPGTTLSIEQRRWSRDGRLELIAMASGEDLSAFEEGLDADATVSEWMPIGRDGGRGIYRVRLTERATGCVDFDDWTGGQAVFREERWTGDEWVLEGIFQDRSVLQAFTVGCEKNGVPFELVRLTEDPESLGYRRSGLTELQLETLWIAFEAGHFSIPREASLGELSEEFGVSRQALSERIRRGVGTLVEDALRARPTPDGHEPAESEGDIPNDATVGSSPVDPLSAIDS